MSPNKPSRPEAEYFTRVESEKKRKIAEEYHKTLNEDEKVKLKEEHWMRCPHCGMGLHEVVFRGVTVGKCFNCHGMFLSEAEVEKVAGKEDGFMPGLMSLFKT